LFKMLSLLFGVLFWRRRVGPRVHPPRRYN
jgi:hypothetical protein